MNTMNIFFASCASHKGGPREFEFQQPLLQPSGVSTNPGTERQTDTAQALTAFQTSVAIGAANFHSLLIDLGQSFHS